MLTLALHPNASKRRQKPDTHLHFLGNGTFLASHICNCSQAWLDLVRQWSVAKVGAGLAGDLTGCRHCDVGFMYILMGLMYIPRCETDTCTLCDSSIMTLSFLVALNYSRRWLSWNAKCVSDRRLACWRTVCLVVSTFSWS